MVLNIWYGISLIGAPELWAVLSLILVLIYFLWQRSNKLFKSWLILFILALFITFGVTEGIKQTFQISRVCIPCPATDCNPYCPIGFSFPSGHASTIFVFFTSLYLSSRKGLTLLLFIIPVLVGLSRYMLDVHSMADVLGGSVLGIGITLGVFGLLKKYRMSDR